MAILREKQTTHHVMDFKHLMASMEVPSMAWKISDTHTENDHVLPHAEDAPTDQDLQKHYALLESRTAMEVHHAEELNRALHTQLIAHPAPWRY